MFTVFGCKDTEFCLMHHYFLSQKLSDMYKKDNRKVF